MVVKKKKTTSSTSRRSTSSSKSSPKRFKTNTTKMAQQASKVREEANNRGGGQGFYKPKQGTNLIRIMPPWSEEGFFYKDFWAHFIPVGEKETKSVLCLDKEHGKKCPACEKRKELMDSGSSSDEELGKTLGRSHRYAMNVLDQNEPEKGVQIWTVSSKMMEEILKWFEKEEWGDITDPEEGYDLEFTRSGKSKMDTKYSAPTPSTKNPTELEDWEEHVENLRDLDMLVEEMDYTPKEITNMLEGDEEEDDEDEEEERTSRKSSKFNSRSSSKRRREEEEEEDDEDDYDEDEDDEDEEPDYSEMNLKQLRKECDRLGIAYRRSNDEDDLIEKLEEFEDDLPFSEEKSKKETRSKGTSKRSGGGAKDLAKSMKSKLRR